MTVGIVRTEWAGTTGGPGLTQLAIAEGAGGFWTATQAQNAVDAVHDFWEDLIAYLPNEISLTIDPVVDLYDETTAELVASEVAPVAPGVVTGINTSAYAMASGLKINWNTGVIRFGRRVKGSTFIVPAGSSVYTNTGTVDSVVATAFNTAANLLRTTLIGDSLKLVVWSRPKELPVARPGAISDIISGATSPKGAILRGRRD